MVSIVSIVIEFEGLRWALSSWVAAKTVVTQGNHRAGVQAHGNSTGELEKVLHVVVHEMFWVRMLTSSHRTYAAN